MIQLAPPAPQIERTDHSAEERIPAPRDKSLARIVGDRAARNVVASAEGNQIRTAEDAERQRTASYNTLRIEAESPPNTIGFDMSKYRILAQLRSIDINVKTHEKAHKAVLGAYAMGQTRFVRVRGPDGQFYTIGGSVKVNTQPIRGNPLATIRKARLIRMAALGPMNPSMQDMRIAAQAYRMEVKARRELAEERAEEQKERAEKFSKMRKATVQKGRLSVLFPLQMPGNLHYIIQGEWRRNRPSVIDLTA